MLKMGQAPADERSRDNCQQAPCCSLFVDKMFRFAHFKYFVCFIELVNLLTSMPQQCCAFDCHNRDIPATREKGITFHK